MPRRMTRWSVWQTWLAGWAELGMQHSCSQALLEPGLFKSTSQRHLTRCLTVLIKPKPASVILSRHSKQKILPFWGSLQFLLNFLSFICASFFAESFLPHPTRYLQEESTREPRTRLHVFNLVPTASIMLVLLELPGL